MRKMFFNAYYLVLGFAILLIPFGTALAQVDFGQELTNVGDASYGEGAETDLYFLIAGIIQVLLGILGVILLIYTMWAGYKWMTAGGNETRVGEAKKMISNAVVGLIIVILSYAIATFVTSRLGNLENQSAQHSLESAFVLK